jgi:hypothetical protein
MLSILIIVIVIQCQNRSHLSLRPLKLDDEVLISTRMRFWSRIKKVCCSSFLKKPHQNPCFLADDLASGHISGNPAYLASRLGIVSLSAHTFQYVLVSGLYENRFQTEVRAHLICLFLSRSLGLKIDPCVNSQEC